MIVEKASYIINIAISLPANLLKAHTKNVNKYLRLSDEIKAMWHIKNVIVIGVFGKIPKKLNQSLGVLQLSKGLYLQICRKQGYWRHAE